MSNKLAGRLLFLCLCVSGFAVLAQSQTTHPTLNITQVEFTLPPGGSQTFTLPNVPGAIRIEISSPSSNHGTQEPSELMWALVNWDNGPEGSEQITWIGTNSDGTTLGSNSVQSTTIASIFGAPTTLTVSDAATGTLEVTRSSAGTIINGNYIVRMYY
jgi:hypothetical protein